MYRELLLNSAASHFRGHIDKHYANLEILLGNPVGTSQSDLMEALQRELEEIDKYDSLLETLQKYTME
jgi:hypothetical protein